MDLHPSELGKVETNNRNQTLLQRLDNSCKNDNNKTQENKTKSNNNKTQAVRADRNVLNQDLLGFVLPNPVMKALVLLHWQSDRK